MDSDLDDDEEMRDLFISIGSLSRRSKGAEAVSMGDCIDWAPSTSSLGYQALKSGLLVGFTKNLRLINRDKVAVTTGANGNKEIEIEVTFAGTGYTSPVIEAAEGWSVCRKLPNGKSIRLQVSASRETQPLAEDVTVKHSSNSNQGKKCRDSAKRGGTFINQCANKEILPHEMIFRAEHGFGHILGFRDVYDESTEKSIPGFETDIMSIATGANKIYTYHLDILAEKYGQ